MAEASRPVAIEEIEQLAIGAWILGTGGGGSPYHGLLSMRRLYRDGAVVRLLDPARLADDDDVAVVSFMGAPLDPARLPPGQLPPHPRPRRRRHRRDGFRIATPVARQRRGLRVANAVMLAAFAAFTAVIP